MKYYRCEFCHEVTNEYFCDNCGNCGDKESWFYQGEAVDEF